MGTFCQMGQHWLTVRSVKHLVKTAIQMRQIVWAAFQKSITMCRQTIAVLFVRILYRTVICVPVRHFAGFANQINSMWIFWRGNVLHAIVRFLIAQTVRIQSIVLDVRTWLCIFLRESVSHVQHRCQDACSVCQHHIAYFATT